MPMFVPTSMFPSKTPAVPFTPLDAACMTEPDQREAYRVGTFTAPTKGPFTIVTPSKMAMFVPPFANKAGRSSVSDSVTMRGADANDAQETIAAHVPAVPDTFPAEGTSGISAFRVTAAPAV
jgi:hypothetical protein